jgi:hypothetical protein
MAGNPPAEAAQPLGMNGMMVTVKMKVTVEPSAPRIPRRLSQTERCAHNAKVPGQSANHRDRDT